MFPPWVAPWGIGCVALTPSKAGSWVCGMRLRPEEEFHGLELRDATLSCVHGASGRADDGCPLHPDAVGTAAVAGR